VSVILCFRLSLNENLYSPYRWNRLQVIGEKKREIKEIREILTAKFSLVDLFLPIPSDSPLTNIIKL